MADLASAFSAWLGQPDALVELRRSPDAGVFLVTKSAVEAGTVLLQVPASRCLSSKNLAWSRIGLTCFDGGVTVGDPPEIEPDEELPF